MPISDEMNANPESMTTPARGLMEIFADEFDAAQRHQISNLITRKTKWKSRFRILSMGNGRMPTPSVLLLSHSYAFIGQQLIEQKKLKQAIDLWWIMLLSVSAIKIKLLRFIIRSRLTLFRWLKFCLRDERAPWRTMLHYPGPNGIFAGHLYFVVWSLQNLDAKVR